MSTGLTRWTAKPASRQEGPLKLHTLTFWGVNKQRHEFDIDFPANSVRFSDGVEPEDKYSLDIHLAPEAPR